MTSRLKSTKWPRRNGNGAVHYVFEEYMCNWAVFGIEEINEGAMSEADIDLVLKAREYNITLLKQDMGFRKRRHMVRRFVIREMTRRVG